MKFREKISGKVVNFGKEPRIVPLRAMPTDSIIRHLNAAKLWIDGALTKYGQGNNHAAYWDVACAENELKLAKKQELEASRHKSDEEEAKKVIPLPTAWRNPVRVGGAVAACFAIAFIALHNTDYSFRLVSPEEVVVHENDEVLYEKIVQKPVKRVFIAVPAVKAGSGKPRVEGASNGAIEEPAAAEPETRETPAVRPEAAPAPRPAPRRPVRETKPGKRPAPKAQPESRAPKPIPNPGFSPKPVRPKPEAAPAPNTPEAEAAPEAPPSRESSAAEPPVQPVKPAAKPKPKPKVDVLELLSEAEKSLH